MIRIVLFLLSVALIAFGFAWVADRPGEVTITWLGYRLDTSILVAALGLTMLMIAIILLWALVRAMVRSPEQVSLFFRHRRAIKGYLAISRGLIAIGAGDLKLARRSADDAGKLSPGDPLTLLLTAQSAQMAGDRPAAEHAFRAMARRDDTRLLGLRGLYVEARRRDDTAAARRAAEEAASAAPTLAWAAQAVLDYRCSAGDWAGALDALGRMKPTLERGDYRRKRAVLLTARAQALDSSDRDESRHLVLEAVKLAPDLTPAAAMAGRRLAESNERRKARRILEAAWTANPHPDIAEAYANLRLGDTARDRLARMQKLAALTPGQLEGALALARAALDAREYKTAREALAPYTAAPTRRVAATMAEIEESEHGDEGRVREWMARAVRAAGDPAWTADGVVSDRWLPVSPNGRLDGFKWRQPLAEIGVMRPVIEIAGPREPAVAASDVGAEIVPPEADNKPQVEAKGETKPQTKAMDRQAMARTPPATRTRVAEPVIPLVHAPDDPGPDSHLDADPVPETSSPQARDPWERFRQMFR
jgi:HemY protein